MSKAKKVGATFLRADLHVHTYEDDNAAPAPELKKYIAAAKKNGISVLAITDHNTCQFVRPALAAAEGSEIFVLPGIEISTRDGHLLALFDPDKVDDLESFATQRVLKLKKLSATEKRSDRSMIDLVQDIGNRGGLAIPAHVDVKNGMASKLNRSELVSLLTEPALAGLEFAKAESLKWFSDFDTNPDRLAAWKARQSVTNLRNSGLARLMSSDSHSPDQVGREKASRALTRLRLDEANFVAIKNAIALNPKARCKAEPILPATYPHVLSASFKGGFLDGVTVDFSENLNSIIGGRGSGKSTALISIRAALGAYVSSEEDPDDSTRMPEETIVKFIDAAGSERMAIRKRGKLPTDFSGASINLRLADLGQEETGQLARGYEKDPELLLNFLDGFVVLHQYEEQEEEFISQLETNAAEVKRTHRVTSEIQKLEEEEKQHIASLKAAAAGRVEEVAKFAALLASQGPFLEELRRQIENAGQLSDKEEKILLDEMATEFGADLTSPIAEPFVAPMRINLSNFEKRKNEINKEQGKELSEITNQTLAELSKWENKQLDLNKRLEVKREELEEQGLAVQATAIKDISARLQAVRSKLAQERKLLREHKEAIKNRKNLLDSLNKNRESMAVRRKATLKRIANKANSYSDDLKIRVTYSAHGINEKWISWLRDNFTFRQPRVGQLADQITPSEFAENALTLTGRKKILALKDRSGSNFFNEEHEIHLSWDKVFELQGMFLLDRPLIEVQRKGDSKRQQFDQLSTGQQRSVLLSLLLCAERSEPLILDQPEDHLDGQYIANSVVRHLEAAKERRQVIIATHSANLVVLGDSELVIPMKVQDGKGNTEEMGAIDRPQTREQVCNLLEGGEDAYKQRGKKYGLRFADE